MNEKKKRERTAARAYTLPTLPSLPGLPDDVQPLNDRHARRREDAENELLAKCRLLADGKDPSFAEEFMETLSTYEAQEGENSVLAHKVNGIVIAFLSAKHYIFKTLDGLQGTADGPAPIEVFFRDIRSTYLGVGEELEALAREEQELDQCIRRHNPMAMAEGSASKQVEGSQDCQSVLRELLDRHVLAEAHVKEAVRQEFSKLERTIQRKTSQIHGRETSLPRLPQSKRAGGACAVSSSFMRARNEAARTAQGKGRRALLKEISEILPHVKYSTLERQNEQFKQNQQQKIRGKEAVELHQREVRRLAKSCEEKLAKSCEEARRKATTAVETLQWEVHAGVYDRHLRHCRKEKAINEEIRSFMAMEDERLAAAERQRREEAMQRERAEQKEMLAAYHDEVHRRRAAEQEAEEMRRLREEQDRQANLAVTEKRVRYRQQLDNARMEERQAREELLKEESMARQLRLERLASSVAPEVEADPARARAHTLASSSALALDGEEGRAFNDVHGYFDDRLFQDQRFRIGEALRAAGLHTTDYGRSVLTDIKSNVQHRQDMRTTYDKMARP